MRQLGMNGKLGWLAGWEIEKLRRLRKGTVIMIWILYSANSDRNTAPRTMRHDPYTHGRHFPLG
jgi:hypothetical protein